VRIEVEVANDNEEEDIIVPVAVLKPFVITAKVFVVVDIIFEFIKLNVVVAITPFVVFVSNIELVVEALERVLVVLDARREGAEIFSIVPDAFIVNISFVDEPLLTDVKVVVASTAVFVDVRLAVVRLVPVALSKIKDDM
jgi:hypothetical protein